MKKQMTEKLNTNKGITLIALVITIIVMLILVAVTISMAVNGGLFEYAGNAGKETNNAIRDEQQLASGKVTIDNTIYNSIDEYLNEQKGKAENGGNNAGGDIQGTDEEEFTAIYIETKSYTDKNGKTAMIPKGFSVGKSNGINTIDEGLVIQDSKGNQFVWIPVEYTASGTTDEHGLDSGFLEVFKRSSANDTKFSEPYEDGYEGEDTEYYAMMLSVQENKGFYIGRFEAGTEEPRYEGVANGTDTLVIKRDVYPYNCVAWGKTNSDYENVIKVFFPNDSYGSVYDENGLDQGHGAVYLSKHLLDGQTTDAVSTLCYGVQWDAMLKFISKDNETKYNNYIEWGNYHESDYKITRPRAKYAVLDRETYKLGEWIPVTSEKSKSDEESFLLSTGASDEFEVKNIFDVAGNTEEWTMEYYYEFDYMMMMEFSGRNSRGECGDFTANVGPASSSINKVYNCYEFRSFRTTIYIINN